MSLGRQNARKGRWGGATSTSAGPGFGKDAIMRGCLPTVVTAADLFSRDTRRVLATLGAAGFRRGFHAACSRRRRRGVRPADSRSSRRGCRRRRGQFRRRCGGSRGGGERRQGVPGRPETVPRRGHLRHVPSVAGAGRGADVPPGGGPLCRIRYGREQFRNAIPFTYETDVESSSPHKDSQPPAALKDGKWHGAPSQSVQYNGDVNLTIDLGRRAFRRQGPSDGVSTGQ